MFDVNAYLICVNCSNDVADICRYKMLPKLVHKTLCSMLDVILKFNNVDLSLYNVGDVLSVSVAVN